MTIFSVEKVVFCTFSRLFASSLRSVKVLFLVLTGRNLSPLGSRGCPYLIEIRRILIVSKFFSPYDTPKKSFIVRVGGWWVGGAYLRFGTFDHVRASFFKFLVL